MNDALQMNDALADLRKRMAVISGSDRSGKIVAQDDPRDRQLISVPDALGRVLPSGALARGTAASLTGARSVLLSVIAAVTSGGGHVAVVGQLDLGLLAAVEMGADLTRIAMIDRPGVDPVEVASILLDGMDVVVLGMRGIQVAPSRARVIMARLRAKGAILLAVDGEWPGAQLALTARVSGYRRTPALRPGCRMGGRIGGVVIGIDLRGRATPPRHLDVQWVPEVSDALQCCDDVQPNRSGYEQLSMAN